MIADRLSLRRGYRSRTLFRISNAAFLSLTTLFILVPILSIISNSLQENPSINVLRLIPEKLTVTAYRLIFSQRGLYRPFFISLYVTVVGTAVALTLTTMLSYALIHKDLPGRQLFVYLILVTMIFRAGLIPTYMVMKSLNILNTLLPVVLGPCINAFYFILMMNFFRTIPRDFAEAAEVEGAEVMTVEGIATDGLHPLQQTFLEEAALQCGICTPGFLVASKALLDRNPDPSEQEVRFWLAGNLCRCTGYDKIIRAVLRAAEEMRREGVRS